MKKTDKIRVIFRKYEGEVTAIFPELPGTDDPTTCLCYAHIGQHGSAKVWGVPQWSTPATPEEYAPLLDELRSLGYVPAIAQRITRADYEKRRQAACRFEFTPA